jgi:xanthine dehydrogenase/oxidase
VVVRLLWETQKLESVSAFILEISTRLLTSPISSETKFKNAVYPRLISPSDTITSIFSFNVTPTMIQIGSCTSLSTILSMCEKLVKEGTSFQRTCQPIHDMLRWFASTQIRNVACLGGNLVTASPISDMNPILAAMGAIAILSSLNENDELNQRRIPVPEFFLRYRVVDLEPTEMVEFVQIPVLGSLHYLKAFKQARRREDDISIVTSGMRVKLNPHENQWIIEDISLAFGGMAPKTILASKTMAYLAGKEFNVLNFKNACKVLMEELQLPLNVPGGQPQYRLTLASSFLIKFFFSVVEDLKHDVGKDNGYPPLPAIDSKDSSASYSFVSAPKPSIIGVQKYPAPKALQGLETTCLPQVEHPVDLAGGKATVGKPSAHMSGPLHCTGEALYADDIPITSQTLHGCLILSSKCGCTFESINLDSALAIPGVVDCFTHTAIEKLGGSNVMGAIFHDETLFLPVGHNIATVGQVLGIAVAETLEIAEAAARAVHVTYGPMDSTVIVSIEDAISANSFFEASRHKLERGDLDVIDSLPEEPTCNCDIKPGDTVYVSGTFRVGGQEHFYLETNCTLAIPSESNTNLTIYSSTQAPTKTQNYCASTTGTPASKVVVRMKRMGGGFGGKETRSVFASAAAAVAAKMTSRPVRLTLARDVG